MFRVFRRLEFPSKTGQHVPTTQYQYADLFEAAQVGGKQAFYRVKKIPKTDAIAFVRIAETSTMEINFRDGQKIEWHFFSKRDSKRYNLEDTKQLIVKLYSETCGEATEVPELMFAKTSTSSYCCTPNCTTKIVQFVRYICTLFNAPVNELDICPSKCHHLEEIQSVEGLKKSREVVIREGTVSHEEMRRVLGGFESTKMTILCNPQPNFTFDGTISIKKIRAYASSWFQGPMLLNLVNCEKVHLTGSRIAEEDLKIFLHEWFKENTGCGTILSLRIVSECNIFGFRDIHEPSGQKEWDLDKIAQGLSSFQQPLPSIRGLDHSIMRRFRRKIDGTIIDVQKAFQGLEFRGTRQQVAH